jgi:hypothetical protein
MPQRFHIVLNYRREDTSAHAGRLYDDLADRFGEGQVFMDLDAIEPGVDFANVIEQAVGSANVFLSLIGPRWLSAVDAVGQRRLDKTDDFVRLEIEAALRPEVRVIPVLVHNATMPSSDELPPSLAPLVRRNAIELRDNSWRYDVGRLIETIERVRQGKSPERELGASPRDARLRRPFAGRAKGRLTGEWARRGRGLRVGAVAAAILALIALLLTLGGGVSGPFGSGGAPRVSIDGVDLEMMTFKAYLAREGDDGLGRYPRKKLASHVLVANASVRFEHSERGARYRLNYLLEKRSGPGHEPNLEVSEDEHPVLDVGNDQCGCSHRFDEVSRGSEYRVTVEAFHEDGPSTTDPLDVRSSAWYRG